MANVLYSAVLYTILCWFVYKYNLTVAGSITAIQHHVKEAADAYYRYHLSNFLVYTMLCITLLSFKQMYIYQFSFSKQ